MFSWNTYLVHMKHVIQTSQSDRMLATYHCRQWQTSLKAHTINDLYSNLMAHLLAELNTKIYILNSIILVLNFNKWDGFRDFAIHSVVTRELGLGFRRIPVSCRLVLVCGHPVTKLRKLSFLPCLIWNMIPPLLSHKTSNGHPCKASSGQTWPFLISSRRSQDIELLSGHYSEKNGTNPTWWTMSLLEF